MWTDLLTSPAVLTALAMAVACATLSVFVVSRRWAFIGEGISHSGFGGAGTAWLLALAVPALDRPWVPYCGVVVFSLVTAIAIGYLTRSRRIHMDTAIGIFMVASFAWGVIAQSVYYNFSRRHSAPPGWFTYLFGEMHGISPLFALASLMACAAVVALVVLLRKEIIYYCFDPAMAEASGVRAGAVHYLLMLLVALTIVIGVQVVGTVLITALLVLPGATALASARALSTTIATALTVAILGTAAGVILNARWPFLPAGPAIVLSLFAVFVASYAWSRARRA
jgi:ABC-type Mn2+/Zn2+ transport system permease subunit